MFFIILFFLSSAAMTICDFLPSYIKLRKSIINRASSWMIATIISAMIVFSGMEPNPKLLFFACYLTACMVMLVPLPGQKRGWTLIFQLSVLFLSCIAVLCLGSSPDILYLIILLICITVMTAHLVGIYLESKNKSGIFIVKAFLIMSLSIIGIGSAVLDALFEDGLWLDIAASVLGPLIFCLVYLDNLNGWSLDAISSYENGRTVKLIGKSPQASGDRCEEIFARIQSYMEKEQPFLNEYFSLNELSRAMYSNKAYLSKAINTMSGVNFCQFVNKYRVDYAVDLIQKDKRLKVSELSMLSGFHSTVSFNMAFRLFMNETPSDYIRDYYSRLI